MRYFIYVLLLLLTITACKKDDSLLGSLENPLFPAPPSLNLSCLTSGPMQFTGNIASWISNDTLYMTAFNTQNSMQLWLIASSLHDSTYFLDGKNGGIQLYDRRGVLVASSRFNFAISIHFASFCTINGYLQGYMYCQCENLPASGQFSGIGVAGVH